MNNALHAKKQRRSKRRLIQSELPTEHIRKPRGGNWQQMERQAAREMKRARIQAGLH